MRRFRTIPAAAAAIVAAGLLGVLPFLSAGSRPAVLGGAVLALGTQLTTHFLLRGWRSRNDRFLAAMLAGFVMRVAAVVASAVILALRGGAAAIPFLLSLGVFIFALLAAETILEHRRLRTAVAHAGS